MNKKRTGKDTPFPYFGNKCLIARRVWHHLGEVDNYVEPFFGSGAVYLNNPNFNRLKWATINDWDGFVVNFWRALQNDPVGLARIANRPLFELDKIATVLYLQAEKRELWRRLAADLDYYHLKMAGLWIWCISLWVGSGFLSNKGPWHVKDGKLIKDSKCKSENSTSMNGLCNSNKGICSYVDVPESHFEMIEWFKDLSWRFKKARILRGDWKRVVTGPFTLQRSGITAIFLDPPYGETRRCKKCYSEDNVLISKEVREWAIEAYEQSVKLKKPMRIAICDYDGIHDELGWKKLRWKGTNGYSSSAKKKTNNNRLRETIWFSPACLHQEELED